MRDLPARTVPPVATVSRHRPPGPGSTAPPTDPAGGTPLPPAWGWKLPHAGRAANVVPGAEFQATTIQACGLNPFVTGAGAPLVGTPVGRDQLHGSVVCLDPLAWLRAGLVTNPGLFLLGEPGVGKAVDVCTPIPTPAGWTTMEALQPGDYVLGEDGHPVAVLAASDVMTGRPCLEVRFGDEAAITADASHQWMTTDTTAPACVPGGAPGTGQAKTQIRTTRQIMDTLTGPAGDPAHSITTARPLQLPDADLIIPPYLLGAWLAGDCSASIPATSRAIHAAAAEAGYQPGRPDPTLRAQLHALRLLPDPHIPGRYLRASAEQRRALLDGLLAATGTAARPGLIAYITRNAQLARDVRELACTLGHAAQLQRPPPGRPGRDTWTVVIPTAAQWRVVSVQPVAPRPVRCIQVASAAGLFLAGECMVPTHNSALAKRLITGASLDGPRRPSACGGGHRRRDPRGQRRQRRHGAGVGPGRRRTDANLDGPQQHGAGGGGHRRRDPRGQLSAATWTGCAPGPTPATGRPPGCWPNAATWTRPNRYCAPGPTPATRKPPCSWPGCWPNAATWTRPNRYCAPGPTPATRKPPCSWPSCWPSAATWTSCAHPPHVARFLGIEQLVDNREDVPLFLR